MKNLVYCTFLSLCFLACKNSDSIKIKQLVPLTVDEDVSLPFISVNGTQLHSETFGNPQDPMLVIIHGGPGADYRSMLNYKRL